MVVEPVKRNVQPLGRDQRAGEAEVAAQARSQPMDAARDQRLGHEGEEQSIRPARRRRFGKTKAELHAGLLDDGNSGSTLEQNRNIRQHDRKRDTENPMR
jgi:hypothetical protein